MGVEDDAQDLVVSLYSKERLTLKETTRFDVRFERFRDEKGEV